jgi:hypothetical protein
MWIKTIKVKAFKVTIVFVITHNFKASATFVNKCYVSSGRSDIVFHTTPYIKDYEFFSVIS